MKVRIYFESPFMKEDSITVEVETFEESRQHYESWWAKYGKDEEYAKSMYRGYEVLDGEY